MNSTKEKEPQQTAQLKNISTPTVASPLRRVKVYEECECGGLMIEHSAEIESSDESVYWATCNECGWTED
jgi:hypothetical protein